MSGLPTDRTPMTAAELARELARQQLFLQSDGSGDGPADLSYVILTDADLSQQDLQGVHFDGAALIRCHLGRSNLSGAVFSKTDAAGGDFRGAELIKAELYASDLRGACFDGANLTRATLIKCDLRAASFEGTDLCGAIVSECDLRGVVLARAKLDTTTLIDNIE